VWLGLLYFSRISSLSGMAAAVAAPIAALALGHLDYAQVLAPLALLVLWLHRANIMRLRAGTEPRVGKSGA
jgi:glycerol-3-phosphate acyltransferase PlsY